MSVQDYVNQKHQGQESARRQALGDMYRVPVPATPLCRSKSVSSIKREIGTHTTKLLHQIAVLPGQATSLHGGGFDTDAEGFDDATITSNQSSRRDHCESHRSTSNQNEGIETHNECHIPGYQSLDPLDAEHLQVEDEEEEMEEDGFEESGEEESGDDHSVRAHVMKELQEMQSAGFSQFRQLEIPPERAALLKALASPSSTNDLGLRHDSEDHRRTINPLSSKLVTGGREFEDFSYPANRQSPHRTASEATSFDAEDSRQSTLEQPAKSLRKPTKRRVAQVQRQTTHQQQLDSPQTISSGALGRPRQEEREAFDGMESPIRKYGIASSLQPDNPGVRDFINTEQQTSDAASQIGARRAQTRKHVIDLDHGLDRLSVMTFQQLSDEPFDPAPGEARAALPQELTSGSLSDKVDYVFESRKSRNSELEQGKFFSSLTIEQYEECGDMIVERFGHILSTLKAARQQRRQLAKTFEDELANREQRIEGKKVTVERDLSRLKRAGQGLVKR